MEKSSKSREMIEIVLIACFKALKKLLKANNGHKKELTPRTTLMSLILGRNVLNMIINLRISLLNYTKKKKK